MHEIVHMKTITPLNSNGRRDVHGIKFRVALCEAAKIAYKVDVSPYAAKTAHGLDRVITEAISRSKRYGDDPAPGNKPGIMKANKGEIWRQKDE